MDADIQGNRALGGPWRVLAIVVDHQLVIQVELGSVVGEEVEPVYPRDTDPEPAGVIDGEPLVAPGDTREALVKPLRGDVERGCVDRSHRIPLAEVRQANGARLDV